MTSQVYAQRALSSICNLKHFIQGVFSLVLPLKILSTKKLIQARLGVSRPIYVNVYSPNLGFPYFNFLGGYQWEKKHPVCLGNLKFGAKITSSVRMLQHIHSSCQQIVVSILKPVWLCALSSRQSSKAHETMALTFCIHLRLTWLAFVQSWLKRRSWLSCCQQKASTKVNPTLVILMIGHEQWDSRFFHHFIIREVLVLTLSIILTQYWLNIHRTVGMYLLIFTCNRDDIEWYDLQRSY